MDILKLKYIFIYFFQAFCKSTHNEAQFLLSGSCHLSTLQLQFEIIMSDCRKPVCYVAHKSLLSHRYFCRCYSCSFILKPRFFILVKYLK
jgi:hypothetical protein